MIKMKPRLFIGNLPPSVTEEELREKFESLLSSHKTEAQVGDVQVRCKNENNYFGFVDVHIEDTDTTLSMQNQTGMNSIPLFLRKSIDLMNNTKWKGSLIKVQLAKESFIEKLRREQEGRKEEAKKPNKDDLNTEQGRNKKQADDILYKLNKSKERRNRTEFHRQFPIQETVNSTKQGDCGFEVVDSKNRSSKKVGPVLEKRKIKQKQAKKSSSSEDDSDEEDQIRDGIPKFKGILVNFPQASCAEKTEPKKPPTASAPLSLVCDVPPPPPPLSKDKMEVSGLNFKKNKQQRSDLLRLKSIEKLEELKTQRKNIIKSSLSTVTAVAPINDQHKTIESENADEEPNNKRPKMTLFDGDDEEENSNEIGNSDDNEFAVKKQFEGASGQKLLELKTRWGNDDRFKIDNRFKEVNDNDEHTIEPVEQEKEKQLNILTDIFGKTVTSLSSSGHATGKTNSVILQRYDPEAEVDETRDHEEETKKKTAPSIKLSDRNKESPAAAQPIRSTEPATFKTVSNLKTLFSSGENATNQTTSKTSAEKTSFSLLATFGNVDDDNMEIEEEINATSSSSGVPRSFWQSNPFKYDSSDDEDEVKVNEKLEKTQKSSTAPLVVHGKQSFFFRVNDPRLQGVEDYFLKSDEVLNETTEKGEKKEVDFAEKRQELKSIVKAKIRNSKRKDEKRTLAIKRAIRKRKRKLHKGHRLNGFPTRRTTA
ncbi:unnamed protein product [Orchesella dallaii]|uniref:RRM domain-containing protein n=1 Tax=Orchesella dallaii TaxID=48710 RepID=A0ABP1PVX7_9HEXA